MSWKPDMFIYHSPCDDGFGAAWAAWKRWGDDVQYVPCSYGAPPPDVTGKHVLVGDFSFKPAQLNAMGSVAKSIVILDHHKTGREDLAPFTIEWCGNGNFNHREVDWMLRDQAALNRPPIIALFDMDKSGARLTWEFCHPGVIRQTIGQHIGEEYVPDLIRFVEDRDLWRFALPETRAFSLYLRSHPYEFEVWDQIAWQLDREGDRRGTMRAAHAIEAFYDQKVAEMVMQASWKQIHGHAVPTVNCSWAFASDVAHALLQQFPAAPFAACYYDRGDGARSYSLRSEDSRMDVSAIARRYGGGGHRNAAGFEVPLP